jgi:hypothetical protein
MLTERYRRLGDPGFCQLDLSLLQLSKSKDSVATHHPKAKRPVIPIMQYPFGDGHCSIAIEIVGPYLALLVVFPANRDSPDRLWVIEWQTGNVKFVSQRAVTCPLGSLLNHSHTGALLAMDDLQFACILKRRHSHPTQPSRLCHRTMLFHTKTFLDPSSFLIARRYRCCDAGDIDQLSASPHKQNFEATRHACRDVYTSDGM